MNGFPPLSASLVLTLFTLLFPQDAVHRLTTEDVDTAIASEDVLNTVEVILSHHSGRKEEGNVLRIKGNGAVTHTWTSLYPLVPEEKSRTEILRLPLPRSEVVKLIRGFSSTEVLSLPLRDLRLPGPDKDLPRPLRYTLGLKIPGKGEFEGEHPDVDWSKLDQVRQARELIQAIRASIHSHVSEIDELDRKFLSSSTIRELLGRNDSRLLLELQNTGTLRGGSAVRLEKDGKILAVVVRPPSNKEGESGMQVRHAEGHCDPAHARKIFAECAESKTFDVRRNRNSGVADEAHPSLLLRATVDGMTYSRLVWLFDGEARETPAFLGVQNALEDLGKAVIK